MDIKRSGGKAPSILNLGTMFELGGKFHNQDTLSSGTEPMIPTG
jgi:hypothetical protein